MAPRKRKAQVEPEQSDADNAGADAAGNETGAAAARPTNLREQQREIARRFVAHASIMGPAGRAHTTHHIILAGLGACSRPKACGMLPWMICGAAHSPPAAQACRTLCSLWRSSRGGGERARRSKQRERQTHTQWLKHGLVRSACHNSLTLLLLLLLLCRRARSGHGAALWSW